MILKMVVGRVLVKWADLDYTGLISADEKQEYHEHVAIELYMRRNLLPHGVVPVFYVEGVESAGNKLTDRDLEDLLTKDVRDIIETKKLQ